MTELLWHPISDVVNSPMRHFAVVLTRHREDLYPVCAFYNGEFWMRTIEGPEDDIREESGDYGRLYRAPTHFLYLDELPFLSNILTGERDESQIAEPSLNDAANANFGY